MAEVAVATNRDNEVKKTTHNKNLKAALTLATTALFGSVQAECNAPAEPTGGAAAAS